MRGTCTQRTLAHGQPNLLPRTAGRLCYLPLDEAWTLPVSWLRCIYSASVRSRFASDICAVCCVAGCAQSVHGKKRTRFCFRKTDEPRRKNREPVFAFERKHLRRKRGKKTSSDSFTRKEYGPKVRCSLPDPESARQRSLSRLQSCSQLQPVNPDRG